MSDGPEGRPAAAAWDDVDGWRRPFAAAVTAEAKHTVVARRVEAAGGRVEGRVVVLPSGLRACLGLTEPRTQAAVAGLEVQP